MNMNTLNEKYRSASHCTDTRKDPDYQEALDNTCFFNKGDFGMLVVPPATRDLAMTIATATCYEAPDRKLGINVPPLQNVLYIDTLTNTNLLDTYAKQIEEFTWNKTPKNFRLMNRFAWDKFICGNRHGKDNIDLLDAYISKNREIDGVFIRLEDLIKRSNDFRKNDFDKCIDWALKNKKNGKTIAIITEYLIPAASYLVAKMDFAINFIPFQMITSHRFQQCSVQWLKYKIPESKSESDSESDLEIQSRSATETMSLFNRNSSFEFNGNISHFNLLRSTANRNFKSGWFRTSPWQ